MNHAFQFQANETKSIHSTYIKSEESGKDERMKGVRRTEKSRELDR